MSSAAPSKSSRSKSALPVLPAGEADGVESTLQGFTSHDLVFAVVGHLGAGASTIAYALNNELRQKRSANLQAHIVKMSELISDTALKLDKNRWQNVRSPDRLIQQRAQQDAGNWLRKEKGAAFTAWLAIHEMHAQRGNNKHPFVFIIDSLKNKNEVEALRKVYGRAFYLLSVVCSPERRELRLLNKKFYAAPADEISRLILRDEHEDDDAGQHVRKTIQLGDFFIDNEEEIERKPANKASRTAEQDSASGDISPRVKTALQRLLNAIFGTAVIRPTRDERGMHAAFSAALRSSCLSRQVGASILRPAWLPEDSPPCLKSTMSSSGADAYLCAVKSSRFTPILCSPNRIWTLKRLSRSMFLRRSRPLPSVAHESYASKAKPKPFCCSRRCAGGWPARRETCSSVRRLVFFTATGTHGTHPRRYPDLRGL